MGKIRTAALAALFAFACTTAAASAPMQITIGDTPLVLPVEDGYVDAASVAPALFASLQQNLGKQDIQPAAALLTAQDAERLQASLASRDFLYVYATIKSLAKVRIDDRDWAVGRRVIPRAIAQVDIDKQTAEMETRMSREATEKAGGKFTTQPPASCGPYRFSDWQQKQKVTLTANPDWPGPKPDFAKVEIYIVTDDQAAQLAYEADAFDYTKIAISATKAVKENPPPDTTIIEAQSTRYVWLTINMLSPRLQDLKVRQAVQYGVDVSQILTGVYDDLVKRSTGVVQPGTKFARAKNLIEAPDYEKSAALLAEAGVSDLTLTLTVMNDSIRTATAQIIQATLEQAGIKVEIQPYDEAAYWGVGDKTQGDGYKNIDLALMDFAGGVDPSENLVWFRPDQIGAYNWSGFDSAEFESDYKKLVEEVDEAKRIQLSQRMEDLMEESGCFVFICHQPLVVIHKNNFEPVIYPDGHPNPVLFKKV
jgi:peptide/nickel transport system substrate-binding protein